MSMSFVRAASSVSGSRSGRASIATLVLAVLAGGFGCTREPETTTVAAPAALRVAVVNAPLAMFVERIAGAHAAVVFPCPPKVDPAFWSPDDAALAEYACADLILLNGANYAKWVSTASLPTSRTVDTLAGAEDRLISESDAVTHSHGPAGDHTHGDTAFTTWLDFDLARIQARAVRNALTEVRPDLATTFEMNWGELDADLAALDLRLQDVGRTLSGRPIIGSHPVYQYLARRGGLEVRSLHWEPEEIPSREAQEDLVVMLRKFPATLMLWEGEPAPRLVEWLASLGIRCLVFDPGGNRPEAADLLETWRAALAALEAEATTGG